MARGFRAIVVFIIIGAAACGGRNGDEAEEAALHPDSLSPGEVANLWPDPMRYPEMREGRLDTVDMRGESPGAEWHVQVLNYTDSHVAMTYSFSNRGVDTVRFAADGQPRLVDNLGNTYAGIVVPENPRLEIETGAAGMGVYVFGPQLRPGADSLTLFINDSTPPVLRVGPWSVRHTPAGEEPAGEGEGMNLQTGD